MALGKKILGAVLASFAVGLAFPSPACSDESGAGSWHASAALTFAINKEGIHSPDGRPSEKVFQNRYLGLLANATYSATEWLGVGAFAMVERGSRTWADYAGNDAQGIPVLSGTRGGPYTMLWLGPMIQPRWRALFLEIGYVLYGIRSDAYRTAPTSTTGDSTSAFTSKAHPAWLLAAGGAVNLAADLDLILKVEYRAHYYDGRGGSALQDDVLVGSQAIRPHVGLRWRL